MLSPNGISAILFDLDGTLRHSRPSFTQIFFDFVTRSGVPSSIENQLRTLRWVHYYWAQSPELLADLETYQDQQELFWTNHARLELLVYGCTPEQTEAMAPEVYRHRLEAYKPEDWVPPDVPQTLAALKAAGFTLGVASNRNQPFSELLERIGLGGYFEVTLAAGEINSWKPEPEIFHYAVRRLGKRPEETLYVGDNYFADVIGAQRAGLPVVLLDPDNLFPEAECPVISAFHELTDILEKP